MISIEIARELRELEENERHDDVYHPIELDGVDPVTDEQRSLYGLDSSRWCYCARCDQAITIEEQATNAAAYRRGRGLVHGVCPRPGSAPRVPAKERAGRVARYAQARA